jgi:hypothetical protein
MKIAFLFLIIDVIHNDKMWREFFKKAPNEEWSIYIHQKTNVDIGWFNEYKLKKTVYTKWGDISLVEAHNLLLETALEDANNDMFIIVSETCLPIRNFDYITKHLDINYSYFCMTTPEKYRYKSVSRYFKFDEFKKASQWCIINRKHALKLISIRHEIIEMFKKVFAADEHAYITTLSNLYPQEIKDKMTTMANWNNDKKNKGYIKLFPKSYILMDLTEYSKYVNTPSIYFIRKINKNCLLCRNGYGAYAGRNIDITYNVDINNQENISRAYKKCQKNGYGGFVFYMNTFYFKKRNATDLLHKCRKMHKAVLILAVTLEDTIMYNTLHYNKQ